MSSFEKYLQQKGITAHTISRSQREVKRFTQWLQSSYHTTTENSTQKQLLEYLQHVKQSRQLCNATQNHILQMLKNYFGFLAKENSIPNITAFIKIRGIQRKHIQQLFTPDELDLLCDAYCHFTRTYIPGKKELYFYPQHEKLLQGRYIALTLMAYQAIQVQEIEALQPTQPLQIGALMQYFTTDETTLIPNRNHFENLAADLKKCSVKFKDFRQLRASKITHWLKLHGLRKAQYLAGHRNINATEKYLAGEFETLQNEFEKFHPLN
jgi:site-specific recombinase XerD